jgi:hypothetical protein
MVLSDHMDSARLRSLISRFLIKTHFVAYLQLVEVRVNDTVAVKVDITAISGLDTPIILIGHQSGNPAMGDRFMGFDVLAAFSGSILQLAAYGIKGVTNGHIDILMGMMLTGFTTGDQLFSRYRDIDAYMIQVTLLVVLMMRLNHDTAAHDLIVKLVELFCLFPNIRLHLRGGIHMAKGDLKWQLHGLGLR